MGTVCAPALLGGLVDLDVLDDQVAGVEALGVGVGLGVAEEREKVLSRLYGPPGTGDTELLACWTSAELAKCPACFPECMDIPSDRACPRRSNT